MIVFRKKDDVYLEAVEGDRGELKTLSQYFTFQVPGYQFTPAYRNKYWDGKIRLFSTVDQTIYAGLWKDIIQFSKEKDIPVEFEGKPGDFPGVNKPLDDAVLDDFVKKLKPKAKGKSIEMRDYQVEAFKAAVNQQRLLLLSPTASGKSLIIYSLIRWWRQVHDRKILIIVPTVGLVSQMISDFKDYSDGKFKDVQGIQAGASKVIKSRVVVSTWQSCYKQPEDWFAQFGSVIVDEVHTAQAKSLQGIMKKLLVCPDRVGLTGTLQDTKTHELVLKGLFGPINKVITTKELMDRNAVSDMKISIHGLQYNKTDRATLPNDYQGEVTFLVNHKKRNEYICRLAEKLEGNTLVIFQRIEHGKLLFDNIETKKKKFYVAGETDKDEREYVRKISEKKDVIIVASLGVFSTGISINNLHNLIFAHPSKSKIKVLQSIGRVLRKSDNKDIAVVYDLVDDLKHYSRANFALRHAAERSKYYKNEKFEVKFKKVDLDGTDPTETR